MGASHFNSGTQKNGKMTSSPVLAIKMLRWRSLINVSNQVNDHVDFIASLFFT